MKTTIVSLLVLLSVVVMPARAEVSPEKEKAIKEMLDLMGTTALMNQMMDQMMGSMSSSLGSPTDGFWQKFREKMKPDDLLEMIIPVYDKYYTMDDIKAANAFYSSPAGQRILKALPQVMQESMVIGQKWGEKIAQQAIEEMKAEKAKAKAEAPPAAEK